MNKITHKLTTIFLSAILFAAVISATTVFAAEKSMSITLRIEGTKANLYYDTVKIPYSDTLTLQEALTYIDEQNDSFAITGVASSYITEVNGEAAGQFGGWDGWLYKVNGAEAAVSIDSLELAAGDSVLLYYGDPYGVGMQFPVADITDINNGIIRFTSTDTTYDENSKATTNVKPVVGATVLWDNSIGTTEYVTDENGVIKIAANELTAGTHQVQISKKGDSGIPLVLRMTPDFKVTVEGKITTSKDNANSETLNGINQADTADTVDSVPKTGEKIVATVLYLVLAIVALLGFIAFKGKVRNEK